MKEITKQEQQLTQQPTLSQSPQTEIKNLSDWKNRAKRREEGVQEYERER